MRLTAEIAGEKHDLDVKHDGSQIDVEIDGRKVEVEARAGQAGVYLLLSEGHVYECRVEKTTGESVEVWVGSRPYPVTLTDPKRLRGTQVSGAHPDGKAQIVAPMPGKVVRVLVEAGAEVKAGDGLVVVEAMKMQNEMKAPKSGKVTTLNVAAGVTVNAGDVLAAVE